MSGQRRGKDHENAVVTLAAGVQGEELALDPGEHNARPVPEEQERFRQQKVET